MSYTLDAILGVDQDNIIFLVAWAKNEPKTKPINSGVSKLYLELDTISIGIITIAIPILIKHKIARSRRNGVVIETGIFIVSVPYIRSPLIIDFSQRKNWYNPFIMIFFRVSKNYRLAFTYQRYVSKRFGIVWYCLQISGENDSQQPFEFGKLCNSLVFYTNPVGLNS
jgi:hypothetical protein